jgi:ubiquinone/menaquinone biosynthesis C-methylase UbiE
MADPLAVTRSTYDQIAAHFNAVTGGGNDYLYGSVREFAAALPSGARVADVGCGPGRDTGLLRAAGLRVVGLDYSMGMLREGGLRGVVQADMRALPLRDAAVEGLWCQAALLHIPSAELPGVLGEFARVVRPDGLLHLAVSEGDGEGFEDHAYRQGLRRWFTHHREAPLTGALAAAGFHVTAADRRTVNRHWLYLRAVRVRRA